MASILQLSLPRPWLWGLRPPCFDKSATKPQSGALWNGYLHPWAIEATHPGSYHNEFSCPLHRVRMVLGACGGRARFGVGPWSFSKLAPARNYSDLRSRFVAEACRDPNRPERIGEPGSRRVHCHEPHRLRGPTAFIATLLRRPFLSDRSMSSDIGCPDWHERDARQLG